MTSRFVASSRYTKCLSIIHSARDASDTVLDRDWSARAPRRADVDLICPMVRQRVSSSIPIPQAISWHLPRPEWDGRSGLTVQTNNAGSALCYVGVNSPLAAARGHYGWSALGNLNPFGGCVFSEVGFLM